MLERLADLIRLQDTKKGFKATSEMLSITGLSFIQLKEILEKKSILDLGCGGGILSESLAEEGANILAIDQSKKLISEAKKRAKSKKLKIDYQCQSIKSLKRKKNKFDIILCMEVIEHVQDYRSFIKLAFECLKKDESEVKKIEQKELILLEQEIILK